MQHLEDSVNSHHDEGHVATLGQPVEFINAQMGLAGTAGPENDAISSRIRRIRSDLSDLPFCTTRASIPIERGPYQSAEHQPDASEADLAAVHERTSILVEPLLAERKPRVVPPKLDLAITFSDSHLGPFG